MESAVTEPQVAQGTYQPVGVPAPTPSAHPGMIQGISGLVCAVIALLFFPPIFGIAGIVLGSRAMKAGERTLGITVIVLSTVFMVAGMAFGAYARIHPDILKTTSPLSGAVIQSLLQ